MSAFDPSGHARLRIAAVQRWLILHRDRGGTLGRRESVDFWTSPLEPRGRSVRSASCLGAARIPGRKHRVDWSGVSRTLETHAKAVAAPTASMAESSPGCLSVPDLQRRQANKRHERRWIDAEPEQSEGQ